MSDAPHNESLQFDELHVVSDLHLGGELNPEDPRSNFQIFDQGELFQTCVNRLIKEPMPGSNQRGKWCLVVNGDLVDFLAKPDPKCFDPLGAGKKLDNILNHRPEFKPVWDALKAVAKTNDATLVIVLGNHDIELALPWMRKKLLDELSQGDAAALQRIHLVFDGTGFRCRVGEASVLCLHGNEVDEWNYLDYEKLREIGRDIHRDWPVANWTPNGGSQLVIDVMNGIKKNFPFIDLLKPESPSVLGPTLLALEPHYIKVIKRLAEAGGRSLWDKFSRPTGLLADMSVIATARQPTASMESDRVCPEILAVLNFSGVAS